MTGLQKKLLASVDALGDRLIALSDSIYECPELGLEEVRTSAAMKGLLKDHGFAIEEGIAGMPTAFRAIIGRGSPVVALLAEMDALPEIGHGCGHNIAGVASVGAACALAPVFREAVPAGTLMVLGTPAEELGKGKIEMIRHGVFDSIDAAMMAHGSSRRTVVKNFVGLVRLTFTFRGRAAHAAAYPENGINALDAVIQTFNSINALRQQVSSDVRIHGIITDGGTAPNIIPERAEASFYVRAREVSNLDSVKRRVIACAEGAAAATGAGLEVRIGDDMNAPMKTNGAFADTYRRALRLLGLEEDNYPPDKNVGSSDIGNVSQVVPTIHPHVPIRPGLHIHTREFAEATVSPDGHRALVEGVRCLGLTALELFTCPDALDAIRKDFISSH